MDCSEKGTLSLTSLLEDLEEVQKKGLEKDVLQMFSGSLLAFVRFTGFPPFE